MSDTIVEAHPRLWVTPALWLSCILFAIRLEWASDAVADFAGEHGWMIRTRQRRVAPVWTVDRAGTVRIYA